MWLTAIVILCLIVLLFFMSELGRPIKWQADPSEKYVSPDDYESLTGIDKEIYDTEKQIKDMKSERVRLEKLKSLNNRKFQVMGEVVKLRKEIQRIEEGDINETNNL